MLVGELVGAQSRIATLPPAGSWLMVFLHYLLRFMLNYKLIIHVGG
jgi:hypothetical protein